MSDQQDTEDRTGRYGGNEGPLGHERADLAPGKDSGTTGTPIGRSSKTGKTRPHASSSILGDFGDVKLDVRTACGARARASSGRGGVWLAPPLPLPTAAQPRSAMTMTPVTHPSAVSRR